MKRFYTMAAMLAVLALAVPAQAAGKMVQIKGSDTLINLVQKASEVFMEKNPGKTIAVTGGGSGTGIAALINRQCDIADSSRSIKDKEIAEAKTKGIDPKEIVIGVDAIVFLVSKDNAVSQISKEDLGKIYRGEIKNWKELGGKDLPISLYGRQPNSGTYDFVKEHVLAGEYAASMKQMNGNAQIVEAIEQDKGGIGYVGIGYAKEAGAKVNHLKVAKDKGGAAVDPMDIAQVKSGAYAIARNLFQYVDANTLGGNEDVKAFIAFELSPEGQKIVEDEGFIKIS